jgi:hypothetical protein
MNKMETYTTDKDCFSLFTNFSDASERLKVTASSAAHLMEFRNKLEKLSKEKMCSKAYPNMHRHMTDAAYEAEYHTRIISKYGLNAMNELRDSGMLNKTLDRIIKGSEITKKSIPDAISKAKKHLSKEFKDIDTSFLDEALSVYDQLDIELRVEKEKIFVEGRLGDGGKVRFPVSAGPKPGNKGRLSSSEFFTGLSSGEAIKVAGAYWVPENCHHRERAPFGNLMEKDLDIYGAYVGAMKNSNELSYLYARRLEEVGTPSISGRDPVTAILVALAIVAAALVISGIVIEIGCAADAWSGDVCDYGFWLIFAGIILGGVVCVASGFCELVIGVIAVSI